MVPIDAKTLVKAYQIVARIVSLGLSCIVPAIIGYEFDLYFGTKPAFVVAGTLLGFLAMAIQLRQLVRELQNSQQRTR